MKLAIKVVPRASREEIAGWLGDEPKIRVRQVPENGKANEAVRRLLSSALKLPPNDVRIVSGAASPHKIVEIPGIDETALRIKLSV